MSVQTIKVAGDWLKKVSYDTDTNDLTIYYMDGSSNRYVDVPNTVIKNVKELTDAKYPVKEIEHYLVQTMTKTKRGMYAGKGRYVSTTQDKYIRVKLSEEEYVERAKEQLAAYSSKESTSKVKILKVEEDYSNVVRQVQMQNDTHLGVMVDGTLYIYEDKPSPIKKIYSDFVQKYTAIKNSKGDEKVRKENSLGSYWNVINKLYHKEKKK